MKTPSLIVTLKNLRGNPRGCVYAEPLWGIPFFLYNPYVPVYMVALGLSEPEIGLIASVGVGFQVIMALFSGVITDKLGRRLTTLVFDILAWSVPALISAVAQNFWYFLAAAIVNSVWRITHNSWSCLLVEDAEKEQLVDIFSLISIANLLVGFVAPLAVILINIFTFVPTVRGLFLFAAVMFTIKAIVTYQLTEETAQGKVRMRETQHQSVLAVLGGYWHVLLVVLRSPHTLYTAGIMLVIAISVLISGNFWAIIVTQKLQITNEALSYFQFFRSAVMIVFFFVFIPYLNRLHFKLPMMAGFLALIASQVVLISAPVQGYVLVYASVFLEACSFAIINPLTDRLTVLNVDAKERAGIQSILYVGIILLTSPFGWIAGTLSALNKDLPFVLNIALFAIGALLAYLAGRASQKQLAAEAAALAEAAA